MAYSIEFHPKVERDLDKIPLKSVREILKSIREKLTVRPGTAGEALKGKLKGFYKLKIADFRVVYALEKGKVYILTIAQRGKVYEIAKQRKSR